jgi:hypothetical protein
MFTEIWIQKTLSAGLLLSAFGSFMFVPATMEFSFPYRFIYSRLGFQFSKLLLIH